MAVDLNGLKEQLRIDGTDDDTTLQSYLDASKSWIQNSVTSDSTDDLFFSESNVQPLSDIAVVSLAMEMWANRSLSMPLSTVTDMMIGQMRGLYSAWKEAQEEAAEEAAELTSTVGDLYDNWEDEWETNIDPMI